MQNEGIQSSPKIIQFYMDHLKTYGDTAKGVGWKDDDAQYIRFEQLIKVVDSRTPYSINDLGCGMGEFYRFLNVKNARFEYFGYDILEEMIVQAGTSIKNENASFRKIISPIEMHDADYTIASGIFNVRYDIADDEWEKHLIETITTMNSKSKRGFAFNCLTKYSDSAYMRSYLYYADPLALFDLCKTQFSKNIALYHDYGLFDFTIIVRK